LIIRSVARYRHRGEEFWPRANSISRFHSISYSSNGAVNSCPGFNLFLRLASWLLLLLLQYAEALTLSPCSHEVHMGCFFHGKLSQASEWHPINTPDHPAGCHYDVVTCFSVAYASCHFASRRPLDLHLPFSMPYPLRSYYLCTVPFFLQSSIRRDSPISFFATFQSIRT
jgi:hypothetical protein